MADLRLPLLAACVTATLPTVTGVDQDRPSAAVQDYLKAIYAVGERDGRNRASTSQVSAALGVSPGSASGMLRRLAELGYVDLVGRGAARLTERGRLAALEVIRHHRLLETFLVDLLGMPWDLVHEEAEVLEHHISARLADRIADALGDPDRDPHGHPIPTADGRIAMLPESRLTDLPDGATAAVSGVGDQNPELLRYLGGLGLVPGARIEVLGRSPFDGPIEVAVANAEPVAVAIGAARQVLVEAAEGGRPGNP